MVFQNLYQKARDIAEAVGQRLYCLDRAVDESVTPFLRSAVERADIAVEEARLKIEPVIERYATRAFVGAVAVVEKGAERLERFLEKSDE